MQSRIFKIFTALMMLAVSCNSQAEKSLDFIAEHILEVPLDFRYLALPQVPLDQDNAEWRVSGGMGQVSSGLIAADIPMIAVHYYSPLSESSGFTLNLFLDQLNFSGQQGRALVDLSFTSLSAIPNRFDVNVLNVKGSGKHVGIGAGYAYFHKGGRESSGWHITGNPGYQ